MSTVEIWYVRTEDVTGDALLEACEKVLAEDERLRGKALRFEKDRHEHLVTRALARGVLGRTRGVHPAALAFRRDAFGRPELDPPCDVQFNLTNTTALVACAVTRGQRVGLDAEPLTHASHVLEVAGTVFTPTERRGLEALGDAARRARAVQLWTAKEAYIKARGLGFSLPPATFEIDFSKEGAQIRLLSDPADDARWQVTTYEIEQHHVALCAGRVAAGPGDVILRRADLALLLGSAPRRPSHRPGTA